MKFRKKPVVIEAWQNVDGYLIPDWVIESATGPVGGVLQIGTLEGVMTAQPGDWLILGVKGEVYPCKPDIFAATYERVEE